MLDATLAALLAAARLGAGVGAEDENVGDGSFVWGHLLGVFEDGGGRFGIRAAEVAFIAGFVQVGIGVRWVSRGGVVEGGLFRLLEGLGEGGLAGTGSAAIRSYLSPSFTEEVAQLPARLHRRA